MAHRLCYLIHLIVFIPEALADLSGLVVKRRGAAGWIPTLVPRHILEASTSEDFGTSPVNGSKDLPCIQK
jgi:hypothetical protein